MPRWKLRQKGPQITNEKSGQMKQWPQVLLCIATGGILSCPLSDLNKLTQEVQQVVHSFSEAWEFSHYACPFFPFSSPSPSALSHSTLISFPFPLPAYSPCHYNPKWWQPLWPSQSAEGNSHIDLCLLKLHAQIWTPGSNVPLVPAQKTAPWGWINKPRGQGELQLGFERHTPKKKNLHTICSLTYSDL